MIYYPNMYVVYLHFHNRDDAEKNKRFCNYLPIYININWRFTEYYLLTNFIMIFCKCKCKCYYVLLIAILGSKL